MPKLPSVPSGGPGAEESLESYIERCARQHGSSPAGIARLAGIDTSRTSLTSRLLLPPADERLALAAALHLEPHGVDRMTIRRFASALSLPPDDGQVELNLFAARHWLFIAGSRYCPRCVAETGQWHLDWRLPLNTRCHRHAIRLQDECPGCGGWPRSGGSSTTSARSFHVDQHHPNICYQPEPVNSRATGRAARPCGADLTDLTPTPEPLTEADALLHSARNGHATRLLGQSTAPGEAFTSWRETVTLSAWLTNQRTDLRPRPLRSPPRSSATTRQLTAVAANVLTASSVTEGAETLLRTSRAAGVEPNQHWFRDRLPKNPTPTMSRLIEATLAQSGRFSVQVTRALTREPLWGYTADQVPQRFWPCAIPNALHHATRLSGPTKQAFVSLCLARFLAGGWGEGARLLGWHPISGRNRARNVIGKTPAAHREQLLTELAHIVRLMDRCPPTLTFVANRVAPDAPLASMYAPTCGQGWCPCHVSTDSRAAAPAASTMYEDVGTAPCCASISPRERSPVDVAAHD